MTLSATAIGSSHPDIVVGRFVVDVQEEAKSVGLNTQTGTYRKAKSWIFCLVVLLKVWQAEALKKKPTAKR